MLISKAQVHFSEECDSNHSIRLPPPTADVDRDTPQSPKVSKIRIRAGLKVKKSEGSEGSTSGMHDKDLHARDTKDSEIFMQCSRLVSKGDYINLCTTLNLCLSNALIRFSFLHAKKKFKKKRTSSAPSQLLKIM